MRLALCFVLIQLLNSTSVQGQNPTLLPAKFQNKWGFINEKGTWVLQPIYDQCLPFEDRDYTWVQLQKEQVLINRLGVVEIELPFSNIVSIQADLIIYREGQLLGWMDRNTKEHVFPAYRKLDFLENTQQFLFQGDYGMGVVDLNGNEIIEPRYQFIGVLDSFYITTLSNKSGLFDFKGNRIIADSFDAFYVSGNYIVGRNHKYDHSVFDKNGKLAFAGKFDLLNHITGNYFEVARRKSKLLMNALTGVASDSMALRYSFFSDQYIRIKHDSTIGLFSVYLDSLFFPVQYQNINSQIGSSNFILTKEGFKALYDSTGTAITENKYEIINEFDNAGYCLVRSKQLWGLIDRKGKEVLACRCTFLSIDDDGIAKCKNPNQVALFEFDKNKQVVDSVIFTNAATINLGGTVSMSAGTAVTPNQSISEYWFMDKAGKWGLKDSSGNIFLKPYFNDVRKIRGTNYVMCSMPYQKNMSSAKDLQVIAAKQYVLIDEVEYRKMTPPGVVFIDELAVSSNKYEVFRIMFASGFCATVNKETGKILNYNSKYIGPFINGYARIFIGSNAYFGYPNRKYARIQTVPAYLREFNMLSNQSAMFSTFDYVGVGYWAYIGADGKYIAHPIHFKTQRFQGAEDFKNNRAIVMNSDSLFGLINNKGEFVLAVEYQLIQSLKNTNDSLLKLEVHQPRFGYVDVNGRVISFPQFKKANNFSGGMAWAYSDYKTFLLNQSGIKTEFEGHLKTVPFSEGMSGIAKEYRFALIDSNGSQTTDFLFSKVDKCSEGLIPLRRKGGYGFADFSGNFIIPSKYKKAQSFSQGLAAVRVDKDKKSLYGFIDKNGTLVVPARYNRVKNIDSNGFAEVKKGSKVGLINASGKLVVSAKYKKVLYGDGVIVAGSGVKTTIFSVEGKKVKTIYASLKYAPANGTIVLSKRGKSGAVDYEGKKMLSFKYSALQPFENDVSVIQMRTNIGIINKYGDTLATMTGRAIGGFRNDLLLVKNEDQYQFVNASGINALNKKFDYAKPFNNKLAIVKESKKYGLIDQNGFYRILPNYDQIQNPENGVCIVEQHNLMGVIDLNGKFVISAECNDIRYDETNLLFQYSKNNKLGYFDRSGNIIWKAE